MIEPPYDIPTAEEIERERQRREEADRKRATDPPLNPLPSTRDALRVECEKHRQRIIVAMQRGAKFHPDTNANFAALLKGDAHGHLLPSLERLWRAATVLDLNNRPPFPGEPQTTLDCVAALDGLLAALRGTAPAMTNGSAKEKPKGRGGRRRLEQSNPLKARVYDFIRRERLPGEMYTALANRLKHDNDFMDMARGADMTKINYKLVRNAIEHEKQRQREGRKKQETDPI